LFPYYVFKTILSVSQIVGKNTHRCVPLYTYTGEHFKEPVPALIS